MLVNFKWSLLEQKKKKDAHYDDKNMLKQLGFVISQYPMYIEIAWGVFGKFGLWWIDVLLSVGLQRCQPLA